MGLGGHRGVLGGPHLTPSFATAFPSSGEVLPGEVLLHRPGLPQREPGRHPPCRVPPGGGGGGRPRPHPRPPHGHPPAVLHQAGYGGAPRGGSGGSPGAPLTPSLSPGITQLRFKPAYNPYTEPSMEVFSYHEGEGGSGGSAWAPPVEQGVPRGSVWAPREPHSLHVPPRSWGG